MPMDILRTKTLHLVRGGDLAAHLDAEITKIFADCDDRPRLKKPRKIVLEMVVTPIGDDILDAVDVDFNVKSSIPATKIARPMKAVRRHKGFGFDHDTDNIDHAVDQRRLAGIDGDGKDEEI